MNGKPLNTTIEQRNAALVAAVFALQYASAKSRILFNGDLKTMQVLAASFGGSFSLDADGWLSYELRSGNVSVLIHHVMTATAAACQEAKFSGKVLVLNEPTNLTILDDSYLVV